MKHPAALFFTLFFLLAMLLLSITASSASTTPELYDLNSGEEINISKVTAVLDVLSGVGSSSEAVDYNGDGKTDITDVTALLNILAGLVPEEPQSYGLEYTLENGYYVVTGIGTCTDQDIILPNTYNGKPVKAIRQGAFERTEITSIVLILLGYKPIYRYNFFPFILKTLNPFQSCIGNVVILPKPAVVLCGPDRQHIRRLQAL